MFQLKASDLLQSLSTPRGSLLWRVQMCHGWKHRVCNTGISSPVYYQLVKGETELPDWQCHNCVNGLVQIEVPQAKSTRLDEDNNLSATPEPMDFDDVRQPNMSQNDRNISPTSSILNFSVDYPAPLRPVGLHESSPTDPEPAEITVCAHMVTYKIVEDTSIHGKDKLFDYVRYSYTMKRRSGHSTT